MKTQLPKSGLWILSLFASESQLEDIIGDLEESYVAIRAKKGKLTAAFFYWRNCFSLAFSYAVASRRQAGSYSDYYSRSNVGLLSNYLKVAWRNMAKQKLFTSINVLGLAMGMSFNILILAILSQVVTFDEFHVNKNRIYRVNTHVKDEGGAYMYASTFRDVGSRLKEDANGIEAITTITTTRMEVLSNANAISLNTAFATPSFFDIFSFPLEAGDVANCLQNPNSIVLSKNAVNLLFPNSDPMGQVLETPSGTLYTVTGVLKDYPKQTHLSFDLIAALPIQTTKTWSDFGNQYVYVMLDPDAQSSLEPAFISYKKEVASFYPQSDIRFELQSLTSISPAGDVRNDLAPFDWMTCVLLFVVGLLILIPAAFNYSNLMIARALKRAKEIGIRKIVGSHKREITRQFIVESMVLTLIALVGGIAIFTLIRAEFLAMIIGAETLDLSLNFSMVLWFFIFSLVTGYLVGIFPARYFARISPLNSIKGGGNSPNGSVSNLRKTLMVVQFSLSLGFVIGIAVISWQYKHLIQSDPGFKSENILVVPLQSQNHAVLKHEFTTIPEVMAVSTCSNLPGMDGGTLVDLLIGGDSVEVFKLSGDLNLREFLGLAIKSSRSLTSELPNEVWINEVLEKELIALNDSVPDYLLVDGTQAKVAGVLQDFNFLPVNERIRPFVLQNEEHSPHFILLSVKTDDYVALLDKLESKWESVDRSTVFDAFFLDKKLDEAYQSVTFLIKLFSFLGFLSITISCIGILGMVVYLTENRTKELAIRKTMGASMGDLYLVLGGSFLKLLLIATVITTPLAYLFYDRLFVQMINRESTGVGWIEMVIGVVSMLVMALLPMIWMVGRISKVNPSENLRYE